jgi:hypothetical protein
MQFKEIYDGLDSKINRYITDNNLQQFDYTNLNDSELLLENQFSITKTAMNIYCVHQTSLTIVHDVLPFNSASVFRLDQLLKNIGYLFSTDATPLESFNKSKDIKLFFVGKTANEKDFFALSFKKYSIFIRVIEESITISANSMLTVEQPLSDDINVDFNLALDNFSSKIAQATGFVVDADFQENIEKTTMSERINIVFAQQNVQDIVYVDKSDILTAMLPYKETSLFEVGVDDFSFRKEDHKTMFALLNKLFFNDCYDTLTKIITVVINYQKAMHREDNLSIGFPVKGRFYDSAKLPVIKIYLNEKYQLDFSTNGYIFTNNAVPQHVKDYKRLPEVLNKILEETERHIEREKLTKQLI